MNILITGSNGQLGKSIQKISDQFSNLNFTYTDIEELDITNVRELEIYFATNKIDVLINCAAYTAVDKAESEPQKAKLINVTATGYLSELSNKFGFLLIHISTDFIFGGNRNKPYSESDSPEPLSYYAKSKADGETEILMKAERAVIFRTSWLYSEYGNNFVKTIINLAKEREVLKVVNDQVGTPTYASDLAYMILINLPELVKLKRTEIYNYSNKGQTSWYDFAMEIIRISQLNCQVLPIETKEYPLPAKRPKYSVLDKSKIVKAFGIKIPDWEYSLRKCISFL